MAEVRETIVSSWSEAGMAAEICWIGCAAWPIPMAPCMMNMTVSTMMAPSSEHDQ